MRSKLFALLFVVCLQCVIAFGQRVWVSPDTTAQQMRNPATWYRPYWQAASESYQNFRQNAGDITGQLYQQALMTGAWGRPNGSGGGANNQG